MSLVTLFLGLLLPWLVGVTMSMALRGSRPLSEPGELAWIAGAGYLVGAFMLTLWMRALSQVGVAFGGVAIGGPLFALAAGAGYLAWRRTRKEHSEALLAAWRALISPPGVSGAARWTWWALLVWIALRFALLGLEVSWQPLFPWNAWTQWATKARVWFELGRIVPFTDADAWFAADGAKYFDAAPRVPPTLPLQQVWASIALGQWDDALMNWPWWQLAAALALAVYGTLRALGLSSLAALVVAYLVSSLPLANVHVALAGYADLPLAAYYACATLAFLRWAAARDPRDAALFVVLALACTQIVSPGAGWAATLVPGVIVVLLPGRGVRIAAAMIAVVLFAMLVLAQSSPTLFGHPLHLAYDPAWGALADSYFLLGSWNLLWYGVLAAAVLAWRDLLLPPLAPLTVIVCGGATMLFVMIAFPSARVALADQTTINRATLQFAPLLVVFAALAFQSFARRCARTHAGAQAQGV
jgi:hypothetical protein